LITPEVPIQKVLEYYMGKNTSQRQEFIIENLKIEKNEILETATE
jgi:topoisomerase-4 subunit B